MSEIREKLRSLKPEKGVHSAKKRVREEIDAMPGEELVDKRTANGKLYSLGENLYQAVLFADPIHYQDKQTGQWMDIDNTLIDEKAEDGNDSLATQSNGGLKVRLSGGKKKPEVTLTNAEGATLSWTLEGAKATKPVKQEKKAAADKSQKKEKPGKDKNSKAEKAADRRRKAPEAHDGEAVYTDILPDTDLVCRISGLSFKDDVIFKTREAAKPISFLLSAPKLALSLSEAGIIRAEDAAGKTAFFLPAPFLMDGVQENGGVQVSLEPQSKDTWRLTYTPDVAWLNSATFPVTLDPAVITEPSAAGIENNYVTSKSPSTVQSTASTTLRVAYNNILYGTCKAFLKFKTEYLPAIDSSFYVTKATLTLPVSSTPTSNVPVYLREVLDSWSPQTITYNNMPALSEMDFDTSKAQSSNYTYDISNLVRKWYHGANNGVALEARTTTSLALYSSKGTAKPSLTINYMSLAGLEGYLSYESHSVGRAGTAHVSLYNGNLIFRHADTACNGNLMPISVTHTYNSCYSDMDIYYAGYGWKHSMQLTLHREMIRDESGTQKLYYVYTDSDGTRHHFKAVETSTTEYADLSGLSLKLMIAGSTATIRDKGDNVMTFDLPTVNSTGRDANFKLVKKIEDPLANAAKTTISSNRITGATDGAGRVTTFSRNAANRISAILSPGYAGNGVVFEYDAAGRLIKITHEDGAETTYEYDTQGLLTTATNADGRKLTIEYYPYAPYRVKKVTESNGTVIGNCREYTYGDCKTTVTDRTVPDGKQLFYHFNDDGNVVSVNDMLGYAAFAKYSPDLPVNHPELVSKMQRSVVNLLGGDDAAGSPGWKISNQPFQFPGFLVLMPTLIRQATATRTVCLEPGKPYTLSFLANVVGADVTFRYQYRDASNVLRTVNEPLIRGSANYAVEQVLHTFSIPAGATSESVVLTILAKLPINLAGNATDNIALLDRMQLEEGTTANRTNLLFNGEFSSLNETPPLTPSRPLGWTRHGTWGNKDGLYAPDGLTLPDGLGPKVMRIYGEPTSEAGLYQELAMSGSWGDGFVIGGWARSYTKPRKGDAKLFGLRIAFKKADGTYVDGESVEWSEEWTDWQFASGPVVAPCAYEAIRYYVDYNNNINYAEFGGLFLYREVFGNAYTYDENNNVVSVQNLTANSSFYLYDECNNPYIYFPAGQPDAMYISFYGLTLEEQKKHLLQISMSPTGICGLFEYDEKGNLLSAKTSDTDDTVFIKGTTTYTTNKNYVATRTNARGKTVSSQIDATKGTLTSVTDANGQTASFTYDALRRVTGAEATADGMTYRNTYAYANDRLAEAKHNTGSDTDCDVVYGFEYDELGNPTAAKVGTQTLRTKVYTETGDKLPVRVEYANGGKVHYERDEFKRVVGVRYDEETEPRYTSDFNANGGVARTKDTHLGRESVSTYDECNRVSFVKRTEDGAYEYSAEYYYDECSRLIGRFEKAGTQNAFYSGTGYEYDIENRVTSAYYLDGLTSLYGEGVETGAVAYTYDILGRLASKVLEGNTVAQDYKATYGYLAGSQGTGSTTGIVSSITQRGQNFTYTYDNVGNIASETRGTTKTTYVYDKMGQLTRVNDPHQSKSFAYAYDRGGNLLMKTQHAYTTGTLGAAQSTVNYTYGDNNWKDKMTAYNGVGITYDVIGNPLDDGTWQYEWQVGRQLARIYKQSGEEIKFAYNASGLRVRKESSRGVTKYTLHGKNIVHMTRGSTVDMHFFYGGDGKPAMVRYNGGEYYYVYNLQGDVVAILDKGNSNAQVVEYKYDAWGKQISCTGTKASTLGVENPFRYRGYVYDEETGWYYLRSRFYNPEWGRFVNADAIMTRNMFAYCDNNCIMCKDPSGYSTDPNDPNFSWDEFLDAQYEEYLKSSQKPKAAPPPPKPKDTTVPDASSSDGYSSDADEYDPIDALFRHELKMIVYADSSERFEKMHYDRDQYEREREEKRIAKIIELSVTVPVASPTPAPSSSGFDWNGFWLGVSEGLSTFDQRMGGMRDLMFDSNFDDQYDIESKYQIMNYGPYK